MTITDGVNTEVIRLPALPPLILTNTFVVW
jgi:hypothetical protein